MSRRSRDVVWERRPLCGAVLVLQCPGYRQAFGGRSYPVPRMYEHAFCARVGDSRPSRLCRFVWHGVVARLFLIDVGGASAVCYRGKCARMETEYMRRSGGPWEG